MKSTAPVPNKSLVPKPSGLSKEQKIDQVKLLIRQLITRDSGFAGLLLWIPTSVMGNEERQAYAYTDGRVIYYCDAFFTLDEPQRLAVVIHETLHVVLRHPLRFKKILSTTGNRFNSKFNSKIANICADAIVIRAIKQSPKIGPLEVTNPYIVTAEDIVSPEDLKITPAPQWSFEMLCHYMYDKVEAAIQKFLDKYGDQLNNDLQEGQDTPADLHMDEVETRIWKERFKRAVAGSEPGSILREVLKDLPDTKTPWEKYFREFMVAYVMPTTTLDWGRPSRRLLASKGSLGYYEPGIQRALGVKTAGIVIDTSGSINKELLAKFVAETNAMMEQTGCNVVVICADAEVQSIEHFNEPIKCNYKCKGGGGTDFRPAITELEKHDIDCCVYLTDMCGTFPEKPPSYPIMWATLTDDLEPPFGRKILVDYLNV